MEQWFLSRQEKGLFKATDDTAAATTFSSTSEPSVYIWTYFGCLDVISQKTCLYTSGFVESFLYFVKDRQIWDSDWLQGGVSVTVKMADQRRSSAHRPMFKRYSALEVLKEVLNVCDSGEEDFGGPHDSDSDEGEMDNKEALCSAPWTPLIHRRAGRAWPTLQRGKCLTLLSLIITNQVSKCLCGYCFSKPRDFLSPFNCDFCIVWKPKCLCFKATRCFRLLLTVNRCVSKQWIFNSSRRVVVAQNMSRMFKLEWRPTASLPGCVAGEQNV